MINIKDGLLDISNRSKRICSEIKAIENEVDKKNNLLSGKKLINNILRNTEKNLIDLREMYYVLNYTSSEESMQRYFRESAEVIGISIKQLQTDYICYMLDLPFLLPNQRNKWGAFKETIGKSIYYAIDDFQKMNDIKPIHNAAISFISYYSAIHKRYIHDNDNQEARDVLNMLNDRLIVDDDSLICDIHYYSRLTKGQSRTVIFVTEAENYYDFYYDFMLDINIK